MCCQNMWNRCGCTQTRTGCGCTQTRTGCGCGCGCTRQSNPTATLALNDLQTYVIVPTSAFAEDEGCCGMETDCGCGCW